MGRISRVLLWLASLLLVVTAIGWGVLRLSPLVSVQAFLPPFPLDEVRYEGVPPPYQLHLELSPLVRLLMTPGGDRPKDQRPSEAVLWVDGVELRPAHLPWTDLQHGRATGWRHEARRLLVRLPDSSPVPARIEARYCLTLKTDVVTSAARLWLLALLLGFRHRWWPYLRGQKQIPRAAASSLLRALGVCARLPTLMAVTFSVPFLWAWLRGWELPARFPFTGEQGRWLAMLEPWATFLLLAVATLGFLGVRIIEKIQPEVRPDAAKLEAALARHWNFAAWFVAPLALMATAGAIWSGTPRPWDLNGSALVGLVPFNDAGGHFEYTFEQMATGEYAPFVARRPLAGALRSWWMLLAGYSAHAFLQFQVIVLGLLVAWGSVSLTRWRGFWAGFAYFVLAWACLRPFAVTHLTAPLGMSWALLAVPATVAALRTQHPSAVAAVLSLTTLALLTRMGSLFSVPALMLWASVSTAGCSRLTALGLALAAPAFAVGASQYLTHAWTSGEGGTGANFAFTLCGLAYAGDWTTCPARFQAEIAAAAFPGEKALTDYLYQRAWEQIAAAPEVLVGRLLEGLGVFVRDLPERLLGGYLVVPAPPWLPVVSWVLLALVGLAVQVLRYGTRAEASFWLLSLTGILASAPVVIFDDGWRALCVSYPVLALALAMALSRPGVSPVSLDAHAVPAVWTVAAISLLGLLVAPALSHQFDPFQLRALAQAPRHAESRHALLLGGRATSGFLVVADAVPAGPVHSVRVSDLRKVLEYSGVEAYQPLASVMPEPPFAFVKGPILQGPRFAAVLAPPEVLLERGVPRWNLELQTDGPLSGPFWQQATMAMPAPADGLLP